MTNLNRRNFLKSSIIGAGGAVLTKPAFSASNPGKAKGGIITRKLGKTGLEIPVVSMGVMRADNPRLVKSALDNGIVLFDTANGYQNGMNEEMLGQVFKDYPRDKFLLQTKVSPGDRDRGTGELGAGATKEVFLEKFETSMGRLQLDYVDILLHHGASSRQAVLHEPVLKALQQIKKEGRTKFIGVSTHTREPEVIRAAIETGIIDVILVAYNFKHDLWEEISSAMADASMAGIGFIGMKNLAGGYLDKEKTKPVDAKAALKWALQDPHLTTCIPGFRTFEELDVDLEVMRDIELTPDEINGLEIAGTEMGMFCQGCVQCLGQCKKSLPVPDIMRSFMYTYGYGETMKARETLDECRVQADPCTGCPECTVICAKGFPVAERISDVSRIKNIPLDFLT
ncbi:aldo/keto reductase [Bacteroidota bacterium]